MEDLEQNINSAIKTGKVIIGSKNVITALLSSNVKLIILSNNCPQDTKERITYYSKLSSTPYSITNNNSLELGSICGKLFPVSAIGVVDPGESGILANSDKGPR